MAVTTVAADGRFRLRAWFVVDTIESAAGVDPGIFAIDAAGAETIWDSDSETFLKARRWDRPVSLKELVELCRAKQRAGR